MKKSLFGFIFWATISCNAPDKKAAEVINKTIDNASEELKVENLKLKQDLFLVYQNFLQHSVDTGLKSRARILFNELSKTDVFIDSLQIVVSKLNRDDVENVKTIKNLLGEGSLGDSLNDCLSTVFQQAKDFSINPWQKKAVDSISANMFKSMGSGKNWQRELFGMTNPLGASLILFGLQKELYNVGEIAFKR